MILVTTARLLVIVAVAAAIVAASFVAANANSDLLLFALLFLRLDMEVINRQFRQRHTLHSSDGAIVVVVFVIMQHDGRTKSTTT